MTARTIASRLAERRLRGAAHALNVRVRRLFDLPARLHIPDRLVLERQILPQVDAFAAGGRVLLVGCDWYAAHYAKLLPRCRCTSIDPDPARARFGVAGHHHEALLQDLPQFEQDRTFEAIVCNGVYGHGLDETAAECHCIRVAWLEEASDDPSGIARALGDVARAKGMSRVAKDAGLSRESLYRALSAEGNPSFATVLKVAKALGVRFHAQATNDGV